MILEKLQLLAMLIFISLLFPSLVFCHGWAGYEQGAKAHGMGSAFTGLADDPTAVFYNPAGIVQLDGTQLSLGFAALTLRENYRSNGTSGIPGVEPGDETNLKKQYFLVPNLYLTSKINDKLSVGFGQYTIFGTGFKWPNSFEGKYTPGGKNAELQTMTLSPVIAYRITDRLSFSVGGRLERADMQLENYIFIAPGVDDVRSKISGDDFGVGWNAALFYEFCDDFSAGLSYRSKMKHSFDDLDFEFYPQIETLGPIPVGIINTKADLDITLPQFVSFGVAWSRGPLTLTLDGYWWGWSENDELNFKFQTPVAGETSMLTPLNWDDTWSWAVGGEYVVNALDRDISLRAGFMYEENPAPSETMIPPGDHGDNLLFNIGLGSLIGPFYSDFYFTYVYTKDASWNNAIGNVPNPGGGPITGRFQDRETFVIGNNITYKF